MGFWAKSLRIFTCLCENGTHSVRRIAQKTGLSKSSVHRLQQAMERRGRHPESWLWETEEGRRWLTRLVVATLYLFGLKRGVGIDTMSEFFARLRLETQVGCSPSALRGVMQALEAALLETAAAWEKDGQMHGEVREIIGAVDETFFEQMILVFMDLKTGYLLLEEVAEDRTYTTWKALVDKRLKALGTGVLYLVSDRAKALIQLAEQGLECFSMPDFFHLVHEIVKSYSLALGRRVRQAHKELTEAQEALARLQGRPQAAHEAPEAKALVATRQAEVTRWEEAHHTYRRHLDTLALTLHPFRIADSAPQTSAQVDSHLQAAVEAIEVFAQCHQLPARHAAITKVRKQLPDLAAVVDWFSRRVLAWRLSITMEVEFCLDAVEEALARYGRPEIFNTDQGSQFTSAAFTGLLLENAIAISMDGRGAWRDNVFVERLWRSVKYEEVYLHAYDSVGQARASLGRYLDFYNCKRPHSRLAARTPDRAYFDHLPLLVAA